MFFDFYDVSLHSFVFVSSCRNLHMLLGERDNFLHSNVLYKLIKVPSFL